LRIAPAPAQTPLTGGNRRAVIPLETEAPMAVAKITEIKSSSKKSFDDAIRVGIARANKTLDQVRSAWIADQEVMVENEKIVEYRVLMKVTFVLK
jgi:flavin-binding protein dodecin